MTLYIDNTIDPLAVLAEGRELSVSPRHFVRIPITLKHNTMVKVKDWTWKNLTGRFCITSNFISFEDPAEASMFAMIRDQFVES